MKDSEELQRIEQQIKSKEKILTNHIIENNKHKNSYDTQQIEILKSEIHILQDKQELQRTTISVSEFKKLDKYDMLQENCNISFYSNDEELISKIEKFENIFIFVNNSQTSFNKYLVVLTDDDEEMYLSHNKYSEELQQTEQNTFNCVKQETAKLNSYDALNIKTSKTFKYIQKFCNRFELECLDLTLNKTCTSEVYSIQLNELIKTDDLYHLIEDIKYIKCIDNTLLKDNVSIDYAITLSHLFIHIDY